MAIEQVIEYTCDECGLYQSFECVGIIASIGYPFGKVPTGMGWNCLGATWDNSLNVCSKCLNKKNPLA